METTDTTSESTESTDTAQVSTNTEIDVQSYEGQDFQATQGDNYIQSDISTNPQEVQEDFAIPTLENGHFDFDNMSDAQLDKVLAELEVLDNNEPDKPEYTLPDKFNNVDDLAKSYKMLEAKMGNFKGAPETYDIDGVDMSDPVVSGLVDTARELNMSNEALGSMMNKFNSVQEQMEEHDFRGEMASLGANASTRINNINNFIDNSMNPHQGEILRSMATSADSISAIESLIQMARPSGPTASTSIPQYSAPTDQEIQAMMYAKDDYGGLKMETDVDYNKKIHEIMNNHWN